MKKNVNKKVLTIAETAVLVAIVILMAFTPLGYLKIGPLSITFLPIPVAVGAIVLGPVGGAILGAAFGLTSFLQCLGIGPDAPLGMLIFQVNPWLAGITCIVPRILEGFFSALVFRAFSRKEKNPISYTAASFTAPFTNTVLFVGSLVLFYGNNEKVKEFFGVERVFEIIVAIVTINALIELVVCTAVGAVVADALRKVHGKLER